MANKNSSPEKKFNKLGRILLQFFPRFHFVIMIYHPTEPNKPSYVTEGAPTAIIKALETVVLEIEKKKEEAKAKIEEPKKESLIIQPYKK